MMKKKILPVLIVCLVLFSTGALYAQATFTVPLDTVYDTNGSGTPSDNVTNISAPSVAAGGIKLRWHVTVTDFPDSWLAASAFGICDNYQCYPNAGDTALWNTATSTGESYTSTYYAYDIAGNFDLSLNLSGTPSGTHYVTILLTDPGSFYSKPITFIIARNSTGVADVNSVEDNTLLYPNPANDELNVVYGNNADIRSIAVYNIIGKMMNVYKVSGNSANLDIENMPPGVYFLRSFNSHGDVVVTRKFTKQ